MTGTGPPMDQRGPEPSLNVLVLGSEKGRASPL